ncbi:helix-turn-helix domain-containing protein [Paenibacillus polymyxa]|uniref:helix-turn-helix domain-containing protein n=1 Tax=Paenibacillus polymyxa TaxID=1406 RepID=UPI0025B6B52C|nr:helix-turn-helix transcriptional regulator [Paenibacillus polymyxa]MDN4090875.1 helix-turn-helix transcriptional regulator [Paenibacillus polymyxa]
MTFDLGKRLRNLRKSKGLTLDKVRDQSGLSRTTLSLWENNKMAPSMEKLQIWATAVGIDVLDIFFSDESEYELTAEEMKLIELFRELSKREKTHLMSVLKSMVRKQ